MEQEFRFFKNFVTENDRGKKIEKLIMNRKSTEIKSEKILKTQSDCLFPNLIIGAYSGYHLRMDKAHFMQ